MKNKSILLSLFAITVVALLIAGCSSTTQVTNVQVTNEQNPPSTATTTTETSQPAASEISQPATDTYTKSGTGNCPVTTGIVFKINAPKPNANGISQIVIPETDVSNMRFGEYTLLNEMQLVCLDSGNTNNFECNKFTVKKFTQSPTGEATYTYKEYTTLTLETYNMTETKDALSGALIQKVNFRIKNEVCTDKNTP